MTRLPFLRRPLRLAILLLVTVACGDGVSPLRTASGYYRLVSVNGQALPYLSPPSMGLPMRIWRGDLVLRPNGTFSHGVGGDVGFGFVADGTYRLSNQEIVFQIHGAPIDAGLTAQVSGDLISFAYPDLPGHSMTFTYRRAQLAPSTLPSDRYRLRSINGRTDDPLVAYDSTIGDTRYVATVAFDSLVFSDDVFFRRHRSESAIGYVGGAPGTVSAEEWTTWGAYESGPGWIVLLHYSPPSSSIPARDSLAIAMDTLVRRTLLVTGMLEERYARP
jgi:hypothetical protein